MKKNDELIGKVVAIGSNMEGIIKVDGFVCFVPYALLGENVKFKILKVTKNIAFCKLIEVLTPAEERVRPRCRFFEKCGGCNLQHLRYKDQLKHKKDLVYECVKKISGLDLPVKNTISSEYEYEYRNKLQLPIRKTKFGNQIGFFAENSHRVVEIDNCAIQQKWCVQIISAIKEFIEITKVTCYDEENGFGVLRHLVARQVNGKLCIVIVINANTLDNVDKLVEIFNKYFIEFSLYLNVNKSDSNVILGEKFIHIFGDAEIENTEFGIKYTVVPMSFIQVNDSVKHKLYADVIKTVNADNETVVIDAYSGAGLMTAMLSKNAKMAYGIEIVKEAVDSANKLTELNNLDNVKNVCAPCEDYLPTLIENVKKSGDKTVVVLDPPRKGCDFKVLSAILKCLPEKIVYVSCSPQTLARDLGILTDNLVFVSNELKKNETPNPKYVVSKIQPYDMFPQTKHVETLVCLEKI